MKPKILKALKIFFKSDEKVKICYDSSNIATIRPPPTS